MNDIDIALLSVDKPCSVVELNDEQLHEYIIGNRIRAYETGWDSIDYKLIFQKHIVITGYGNHGKGTFVRQLAAQTMLLHGFKWAFWAPEDMPAEYFYGDIIHTITARSTETHHHNYIGEEDFVNTFKAICNEIKLLDYENYPDYTALFMDFQTLHDVNGINCFVVDPFNNINYDQELRDDKLVRAYCLAAREFVVRNNAIIVTVVHPKSLSGHKSGADAPMPTYHDLMYGSEWNKYVDDILAFHHPTFDSDSKNDNRQLGKRKVKKQKICGKTGVDQMVWNYYHNTIYDENGKCYMREVEVAPKAMKEIKSYYEAKKSEDMPF